MSPNKWFRTLAREMATLLAYVFVSGISAVLGVLIVSVLLPHMPALTSVVGHNLAIGIVMICALLPALLLARFLFRILKVPALH